MSRPAISVENLSKAYRIGLRDEIPDSLLAAASGWARSPFRNLQRLRRLNTFEGNGHDADDILWALKDVSFEVPEGEVLGVIGRNGAGKSTLLKILSRITEPTSGRAVIRGRVSSLLEVGTGFHDELTGRENVYMNATILGMTKREIDRRFDEIVDFSGVEKFLDTPVKRYSSGMKVRLAFGVAAHLEPEILIIDEVLAVGDAEFQSKCLGKMHRAASAGRTVLFVSHNMTAVRSLCARSISLHHGTVFDCGPTNDVVDRYLGNLTTTCNEHEWTSPDDAPGNERLRLRRIGIHSCSNAASGTLPIDQEMRVTIEFWNTRPGNLNLSLHVLRAEGATAFASASPKVRVERECMRFTCRIPANLLNDGLHIIKLLIVENARPQLILEDVLAFETVETKRNAQWLGRWPGAVRPLLEWDATRLAG